MSVNLKSLALTLTPAIFAAIEISRLRPSRVKARRPGVCACKCAVCSFEACQSLNWQGSSEIVLDRSAQQQDCAQICKSLISQTFVEKSGAQAGDTRLSVFYRKFVYSLLICDLQRQG